MWNDDLSMYTTVSDVSDDIIIVSDDIITWKRFLFYSPFIRVALQRVSDTNFTFIHSC